VYIVGIPFYKNEEFIENFLDWYKDEDSKLDREIISEVLILNDYPDGGNEKYLAEVCRKVGFKYIRNDKNIGYLKTANKIIDYALKEKLSLVLMNSDTKPVPGFLKEINNCFNLDPMLGIVAPRSNNATICNLYNKTHYTENINQDLEKYNLDSLSFSQNIPDVSYAPVVTGFCFAIKYEIINTFGGFDDIFTVGYEEENDYCLKVSERGYRIGISNKAFVAHMEGKSFGLTGSREKIRLENSKILRKRYPYYDDLLANYSSSIGFRVASILSDAIESNGKFFIDARSLSPIYNGTNKVIVNVINALNDLGLSADVLVDIESAEFHKILKNKYIKIIGSVTEKYEFGIKIGQPMDANSLWLTPSHCVRSMCIFFDTIAHDCPNLKVENSILDSVWTVLPYIYSNISFISNYSADQFRMKFGSGFSKLDSNLLPIEITKVNDSAVQTASTGKVLVFSNKFKHKAADLLIDQLEIKEGRKYYIFGQSFETNRDDVEFIPPGSFPASDLHLLMQEIEFALFPSFSEGFGYPIIEAISYGKPIYCRDIECYREIVEKLPNESKSLVRFVNDFSNLSSYKVHELNGSEDDYGYDEYVIKLLQNLKSVDVERIFDINKLKIIMSSNVPLKKFNTFQNAIRKIYGLLLKMPFGSEVRKIKELIKYDKKFNFLFK
jgi:GT2 family glycosyltransferase